MQYIKEKTAEELDLEDMELSRNSSLDQLKGSYINGYIVFWQNPQVYCDIAGTNAYKLFTDHRDTGEYLSKMIPDFVQLGIPDEYESPIFNKDGTVTITKKILPTEEEVI